MLAGGNGRRLGTVDKPALVVAGRTLLDVALDAVAPALTVVVGPVRALPPAILQTREEPPHGGPAAGLVAGLAALSDAGALDEAELVAVLAADLPGIDAAAIRRLTGAVLRAACRRRLLVDPSGRDQYLAGVWRARCVW